MAKNLGTFTGKTRAEAIESFDRLPRPVKRWAHQAALPWSTRSLRRLAARYAHDLDNIHQHLERIEAAQLSKLR